MKLWAAWNEAMWLDVASHVIDSSQSEIYALIDSCLFDESKCIEKLNLTLKLICPNKSLRRYRTLSYADGNT